MTQREVARHPVEAIGRLLRQQRRVARGEGRVKAFEVIIPRAQALAGDLLEVIIEVLSVDHVPHRRRQRGGLGLGRLGRVGRVVGIVRGRLRRGGKRDSGLRRGGRQRNGSAGLSRDGCRQQRPRRRNLAVRDGRRRRWRRIGRMQLGARRSGAQRNRGSEQQTRAQPYAHRRPQPLHFKWLVLPRSINTPARPGSPVTRRQHSPKLREIAAESHSEH